MKIKITEKLVKKTIIIQCVLFFLIPVLVPVLLIFSWQNDIPQSDGIFKPNPDNGEYICPLRYGGQYMTDYCDFSELKTKAISFSLSFLFFSKIGGSVIGISIILFLGILISLIVLADLREQDSVSTANILNHIRNDADTLPEIIKQVGFDFHWDSKKVWVLDVPTQTIDIEELTWHFDIPFWEKDGTDAYNLTPWDVIHKKEGTLDHQKRVNEVDLQYPIDIMENKGKYVILDGLHRLVKAYTLGQKEVQVRIIPRKNIPDIVRI